MIPQRYLDRCMSCGQAPATHAFEEVPGGRRAWTRCEPCAAIWASTQGTTESSTDEDDFDERDHCAVMDFYCGPRVP